MIDRIYYRWSNLKNGIRNLIKWWPVIWRDRDWDHSYLSRLIEFKLVSMYVFLNSDRAVGVHEKKHLANLARAALAARLLWRGSGWEREQDYVDGLCEAFRESYLYWWD